MSRAVRSGRETCSRRTGSSAFSNASSSFAARRANVRSMTSSPRSRSRGAVCRARRRPSPCSRTTRAPADERRRARPRLVLDVGHGHRRALLPGHARACGPSAVRQRVGGAGRRTDPAGAARLGRGDGAARGHRRVPRVGPRRHQGATRGARRLVRRPPRGGAGRRAVRVVQRPRRQCAAAVRVHGRPSLMAGRRVAVVGAGMTRFVRRAQETGKELAWEASRAALDSCELKLDDVDAVCLTSAPDAFDGVHMKGEYLSDGAGAFGKPFVRTYVGGGSGVFTAIQGWYTVAGGTFDVALLVAEEKMSSTQPHPQGAFLTIFDNILERPLGPNLLWIFALEMNRYMTVHGLDKRDIASVAVKNKRNAADHPAALLGQPDITVDDVLNSETLAWPVQRLDVSPISDGAVALVIASEDAARRITDKPVWIDGVGWNLDTTYWTNRDLYFPEYVQNAARMAYDMAGITEPRKQIHLAEPYDPFDYKELHHLEGLMLFDKGKAPEAARDGVLNRDGDLPSCPSGGLLGVGNPIAAAGLMKIAELYWQLSGQAGARQVPGTPERGVAQAWGDLMQVGTVVVMGRDGGPPTTATRGPEAAEGDAPTEVAVVQTPPYTTAGHSLRDAEFRSATG